MITLPAHNIIIDLETLSTAPDAAILSIGAVAVDVDRMRICNNFYRAINPDQDAWGRKTDPRTLEWWNTKVHPETKQEAFGGLSPLPIVLQQLRDWMRKVRGGMGAIGVWGNGVAFDNVILKSAYDECDIPAAWHYRYDRCYRTLASFYPHIKLEAKNAQPHHALYDALYEARHFLQIIEHIRKEDTAFKSYRACKIVSTVK